MNVWGIVGHEILAFLYGIFTKYYLYQKNSLKIWLLQNFSHLCLFLIFLLNTVRNLDIPANVTSN